jgi:hypothetical protein
LVRTANNELLKETTDSATARHDRPDEWEPDWIEERAACMLACNRCHDPVVFAAAVQQVPMDVEEGPGIGPGFRPVYFFPPLPIIDVPREAAEDVRVALQRAFSLYWADPSAAGNSIRTAIELMLDQHGIPRGRNDSSRNKRFRRSLHERLELFAGRRPELKDTLMAIKWLGNAGSHAVLTHDDVLDAFEFVEHTLDEVYRDRLRTLAKKAKAINRNKGPQRRPILNRSAKKPP